MEESRVKEQDEGSWMEREKEGGIEGICDGGGGGGVWKRGESESMREIGVALEKKEME